SNENNGFEAAGVRFEERLLVVAFPEPDLADGFVSDAFDSGSDRFSDASVGSG
ncbi:MAG: hypothetical protein ACI8P0_003116, partial [Planctomycetaceae bacterium]